MLKLVTVFDMNIPTLQRDPEGIMLLISSAITDDTVCCHGNQESVVSMATSQQTADGSIFILKLLKKDFYIDDVITILDNLMSLIIGKCKLNRFYNNTQKTKCLNFSIKIFNKSLHLFK